MAVTLYSITQDLKRFGYYDKHREEPLRRVLELKIEGWVGVKQLLFRALVQGETGSYLTYVMFNRIEFNENKDDKFSIPCSVDGRIMYAEVPDIREKTVRLKCGCANFRFSYEKQLYDVDALIGNWRRYTRVTPPSGRPSINPMNYLGYCKHVYAFLATLKKLDYIKE